MFAQIWCTLNATYHNIQNKKNTNETTKMEQKKKG